VADRVELCRALSSLAVVLKAIPLADQVRHLPLAAAGDGGASRARAAGARLRQRARDGDCAARVDARGAGDLEEGAHHALAGDVRDLVERAWTAVEGSARAGAAGRATAAPLGPRTPGAVEALARTLHDLRMGGVAPAALGKGAGALAAVYTQYMEMLAADPLGRPGGAVHGRARIDAPAGTKLVFAGGMYEALSTLERALVDASSPPGANG